MIDTQRFCCGLEMLPIGYRIFSTESFQPISLSAPLSTIVKASSKGDVVRVQCLNCAFIEDIRTP